MPLLGGMNMGYMTGERVQVTVQFENGRMINMHAMMARLTEEVEMHHQYILGDEQGLSLPMRRRFHIEAEGFGSITESYEETKALLHELQTQPEWKCPYCNHVNLRSARNCGEKDTHALGCGAARPFLYGE